MEIFVRIVTLSLSGRCDGETLEERSRELREGGRCFVKYTLLFRSVLDVQILKDVKPQVSDFI